MVRLHLVVEGPTEEVFVRDVLRDDLVAAGVLVDARSIRTSKNQRGGFVNYQHLRNDLGRWMREDRSQEAYFSTMVDLYRVPVEFPGYDELLLRRDVYGAVRKLEAHFHRDFSDDRRFIPHVQLHEFETLVFVDLSRLLELHPGCEKSIRRLQRDVAGMEPEQIDQGETSAPSKRICAAVPAYKKATDGPIVVGRIGLPRLEQACPHFASWMQQLRRVGKR